MELLLIWELSKFVGILSLLKLGKVFFEKIWVELRNCPWVGRLKLVASVRERPPATASLTRSRNSYAVSPQLWTTNESNLRNYLFNKISTKNFVRNSLTCIFLYLVSNKEKTYAKWSKMLEIGFSGIFEKSVNYGITR